MAARVIASKKRGKRRDPNSRHQLMMSILFGEDEASKQKTTWATWPEPQRSIYGRMFQRGALIAYADELAQAPSTEIPENHRV